MKVLDRKVVVMGEVDKGEAVNLSGRWRQTCWWKWS